MSQSRKKVDVRIEADARGEVEIPGDVFWGVGTSRFLGRINPPELKVFPPLVRAFALTKKASATVNSDLGYLDRELAGAIAAGCDQLQEGNLSESIVVSGLHGALGAGLNTNINEVIANYGNQLLGHELGRYEPIAPWKHVNMNQGVNDVYITAMRLSILLSIDELTDSLLELERMLRRKSLQFERVIKPGRICLQDASPVTLGQELNAHGSSVEKSLRRILDSKETFKEVNIGGGDIGTGYNIASSFREKIIYTLAEVSGLELKPPDDYFRVGSSLTDFAQFSSTLKELALDLTKIASDLRLMSSGPAAGLSEITLEESEEIAGRFSTDLIPESLIMVCHHVCGNDLAVSLAQTSSHLETNGSGPLVIHKILESISLMAHSINRFSRQGLSGIVAHQAESLAMTERTRAFKEILVAEIGKEKAEEVVKKTTDVKGALQETNAMPRERIEAFYHHRFMTSAKRIIPFIKEKSKGTGTAPAEEDKGRDPDKDRLT